MSDTTKTQTGSSYLSRVLSTALGLNIIFALVAATLGAVSYSDPVTLFGTGVVGTVIGVALSWVLGFVVSFLQGGIFMVLLGGFVLAGNAVLSGLSKLRNRGGQTSK